MIITRNWLNEWINLGDRSTEEICETLNKIGLEVSSVTKYRMIENCVVGFVESKTAHQNAEKLSVCTVNVGQSTPLQIVCGAKNVAEGQWVAVALVGCRLPDDTIIKEAELRGVKSSGMICSSTELGYPKTNDGIMILDNESLTLKPGTPLSSLSEFKDDAIEIELTPNRGDCLSIYGIARDLGAVYDTKIKVPSILPDDSNQIGIGRVLSLSVESEIDASLVYEVVYPKEVKVSTIMELRLAMIASPAKSLIEKHLYYAAHATGVIFRAYKMDIFEQSGEKIDIIVKKDPNGFDTVYGKEQISRVGVWQSENSKSGDKDDVVVVEASFVDPYILGKTGARNAKESDWALFRTLRGSETDLDFGINYLNLLLNKTSKVGILNGTQRAVKEKPVKQINVDFDDMFSIIGTELDKTDIVSMLKNLGFHVAFKPEQNSLVVDIPSFRHDIANIQDICEEVVRIVGIDNINAHALEFVELNRTNKVYKNFEKRKFYRYRAVAAGFFEGISYIFTERARQKAYGFACVDEELDLTNPITNELNTLRTTCVLNLSISAGNNIKTGRKSVNLFEVGKIFDEKRNEKSVISFVSSGESGVPNPSNHGKPSELDFAAFARKIGAVLGEFDIVPATPSSRFYSPYEYGKIVIGGESVGTIGRVAVEKEFDLGRTYVCEVFFDKLPYERKFAQPYSKLPSVSRDLSLIAPKTLSYSDIKACLSKSAPRELRAFYPIDVYEDSSLGEHKSLTLTLVFEPDEKTFTDAEINTLVGEVLDNLMSALKVTIR